jgi:hypothetical protein
MSKAEQYRRGLEFCLAKAARAPVEELREIWKTVGESYKFLLDLESRPRDPFSFRTTDDA